MGVLVSGELSHEDEKSPQNNRFAGDPKG